MGFDEHAEFLDFSVINLPKYEAILGKPGLDSWSPAIDWQKEYQWCGKWGRGQLQCLECRILRIQN